MLIDTITIVGVGLIGGSVGMAAKKRGLARRIVGVDRDPRRLESALQRGACDEASSDVPGALRSADLVVLCTPVDRIVQVIEDAVTHCRRGTIICDTGSTKGRIVHSAEANLPPDLSFVGAHPLAGSEKSGCEYADADMFVDRWTILTPTERTPKPAIAAVAEFWQALGSGVRTMTPDDHDDALALTSHLPHLVASALASMLPLACFNLAAAGFCDTTRVASGDPDIWTPIFLDNGNAILAALDRLQSRLSDVRKAMATQDRPNIDQFLAQGKKVRDALGS